MGSSFGKPTVILVSTVRMSLQQVQQVESLSELEKLYAVGKPLWVLITPYFLNIISDASAITRLA